KHDAGDEDEAVHERVANWLAAPLEDKRCDQHNELDDRKRNKPSCRYHRSKQCADKTYEHSYRKHAHYTLKRTVTRSLLTLLHVSGLCLFHIHYEITPPSHN